MTRRKPSLTVVTNSERQAFLDCPQKWHFAYVENLRPKVAPRALGFGSAVHAGLAAGYSAMAEARLTGTERDPVEAAEQATAQKQQSWYADLYEHSNLNEDALEQLANDAEQTVATARWMVRHYFRRHAVDQKHLMVMGIEMPYELTLVDRSGRRLPHLRAAGVLDLVAYDETAGDIVLADHKTTSGEVGSIDRRVELDPQMAGYLWALRELVRRKLFAPKLLAQLPQAVLRRFIDGKLPTGRVVYNVLRKKQPRVPPTLKNGRVSAAAIDTLAEVYDAALVEQEQRGFERTPEQRELLSKLEDKGDTFLSRREFFRSDEEVARWRREVFLDASRMREARRDTGLVTRNAGHCTMPWSMPCVYRNVCLDPEAAEHRAAFRVADERHEEVAEAREPAEDEAPF